MNLGIKNNNNTARNVGLIALAAAALAVPAVLLYRRYKASLTEEVDELGEKVVKKFSPSYRGNHKPHHRKASSHGHVG